MATENEQPGVVQASADDLSAKLEQLKASATQQYSLKNYTAAAEFYSEAAEIQDEINGEMSVENADLLYQYGRCLYHVAVSNSDVLGGKVAGSSEEPKRKKRKVAPAESSASAAAKGEGSASLISDAIKDGEQKLAEDVVEAAVEEKDSAKPAAEESDVNNKPYFQITGDENWTDSEDEDADPDADPAAAAEEEEDDFATAYEILDMARVLLSRRLSALPPIPGPETAPSSADPERRQIQERLADTHDLQAEISLENERFADAIHDAREALALKRALYPVENALVAEAHFKLSLALEFASVTTPPDDPSDPASSAPTPSHVDDALRAEAAAEMASAIASCRARVAKEEAALASLPAADEKKEKEGGKDAKESRVAAAKRSIADVKDMVADMEQRLADLRTTPGTSLSALNPAAPVGDPEAVMRGVLGAMLGESPADRARRIAEATEGANDLSGLVKHRKKEKKGVVEEERGEAKGKGKRRVDDVEMGVEGRGGANGKKIKFEG